MRVAPVLVVVALALAAGAVLVRDPSSPRRATVDLVALAAEVEAGGDHVSVAELQKLLTTGAPPTKTRVLDIRTAEEFAAGHLPGAENVPLLALQNLSVRRDEPVVIYSAGGIHSAQAWFFLRARGIRSVRFLVGGYDEWARATQPRDATTTAPSSAPVVPNASDKPSGVQGETANHASTPPAPPALPRTPRPKADPNNLAAQPRTADPTPSPVRPPAAKPREGC